MNKKQLIQNILLCIVFVFISCAVSIPDISGYTYIGTIVDISQYINMTELLLNNGSTLSIQEHPDIGDYVYKDKYGQIKIISKNDEHY